MTLLLAIYIIGVVGTFIACITPWDCEDLSFISSLIISVLWPVFFVAGVMRKLMQE